MGRIFLCITVFGIIEFSTSINCAILHSIENEMDCLSKSLPSKFLSLIIPTAMSASIVQVIYLIATDYIPSLVFIFLYLERI